MNEWQVYLRNPNAIIIYQNYHDVIITCWHSIRTNTFANSIKQLDGYKELRLFALTRRKILISIAEGYIILPG